MRRYDHMEDILQQIIDFLLPQNDAFLYLFLFLSAIVENLFPPIPGDTITAFGAFLVGQQRLNYWGVYACTTLGSVMGFMTLYAVGRFLEREFFMKKNYRFFSAESIIAAEEWFRRRGLLVVLGNRFLPGVRSVISIVSGLSRLNAWKVFFLALASAAVWNLIWIHVGFTLGKEWAVVKAALANILEKYNIAAGIALMAIVIIYFILKKLKRPKKDST
jgi:membrane protein DedA with SNARE-associated domain